MKFWFRQHQFALSGALGRLLRAPGSFLLNVLVVAIALALPLAGFTLLENIRPVSSQLAVEPEISIFMRMDTPREQSAALAPQIRKITLHEKVAGKLEFVPREKALTMLQGKSGLSDALMVLGENPLPDGYILRLPSFESASQASRVDHIAAQLKALPGVEYVQVDSGWVKRLAALMRVLHLGLLFLAITLGAVVVAVVFNTIRLQVLTQREEIEVCRLFGATDSYIYRPFYYTGALLGLIAGLAALAIVGFGLIPLNEAIAEFARLYASEFQLNPLNWILTSTFLFLSALLGFVGALLSVKKHLVQLG